MDVELVHIHTGLFAYGGESMSHAILISLNPNLFALCVVVGMAAVGLLLGLTTGGVFALLLSSVTRKSELR